MKPAKYILGSLICLTGCQTVPSSNEVTPAGFDSATLAAAQLCHDHVWFNVPKFESLPNAAVSAFPASEGDGTYVVYWNVSWDDPKTRAAGSCTIFDGKVTGFEDYTE